MNLPSIPLTVYAGNNAVSKEQMVTCISQISGEKKASDTPTGIAALGKLVNFNKAYRDRMFMSKEERKSEREAKT